MIKTPAVQKGMTLVVAILLISFVTIVVAGITFFIVEIFRRSDAQATDLQCIYLAQAGIQNAIYQYRFRDLTGTGYFNFGQTSVDAGRFFVVGGNPADMVMVNSAGAHFRAPDNKNLEGITMQSASSTPVTIDRMIVSWSGPSLKLTRIRIGNSNVWNNNQGLSSPANCNINPNVTLSNAVTNLTYLRWNAAALGMSWVKIEFVMTDGSTKVVQVYPYSASTSSFRFTVKATGKTTGSPIYRTIEADYNASTNNISRYNEISAQITP